MVYQEISRCGGRDKYRAVEAQERAAVQARRPKPRKLAVNTRLHEAVRGGLGQKWSPEQVSNRLRTDHPDDPELRVTHETIYQTLFLQAVGTLKTELKITLRSGRVRRRPAGLKPQALQAIPDIVNISERPAEAADRSVPGYFEGDLIIGKGCKSQVATLVDRRTRYTTLVRIPYDRTAAHVAIALSLEDQKHAGRSRPVAHLGPGERDGRTRHLHPRDERSGLLRRPTFTLAAADERKR